MRSARTTCPLTLNIRSSLSGLSISIFERHPPYNCTPTNFPRVAKFVGVQLYGGWRSKIEMERPLREDLIFRVKGQVVRAERITVHNVKKSLQHFILQSGHADKWTGEA